MLNTAAQTFALAELNPFARQALFKAATDLRANAECITATAYGLAGDVSTTIVSLLILQAAELERTASILEAKATDSDDRVVL